MGHRAFAGRNLLRHLRFVAKEFYTLARSTQWGCHACILDNGGIRGMNNKRRTS